MNILICSFFNSSYITNDMSQKKLFVSTKAQIFLLKVLEMSLHTTRGGRAIADIVRDGL